MLMWITWSIWSVGHLGHNTLWKCRLRTEITIHSDEHSSIPHSHFLCKRFQSSHFVSWGTSESPLERDNGSSAVLNWDVGNSETLSTYRLAVSAFLFWDLIWSKWRSGCIFIHLVGQAFQPIDHSLSGSPSVLSSILPTWASLGDSWVVLIIGMNQL